MIAHSLFVLMVLFAMWYVTILAKEIKQGLAKLDVGLFSIRRDLDRINERLARIERDVPHPIDKAITNLSSEPIKRTRKRREVPRETAS